MTTGRETPGHPTDMALAAWVDERTGEDVLAPHLAHCAACRERVAGFERVVAALGATPAAPDPAALAAGRERILAALGARPAAPGGAHRLRARALWWTPIAAAAVLAALVLLRGGETGKTPPTDTATLPVIAAAQRAADETAAALEAEPAETVDSASVGATDSGLAGVELAILDPSGDPLPGAVIADFDLADEFSGLAAEEQEAVLAELGASDFEL